ncbi:unnamed protein product (macronuclear) [Paramecium tetraurelia]|uniref:Protein kinase domain-containing protein n=1 Tax=Paramecium tetraurelia TaxID=5888 RepID=A0E119_PARTE|nr:uncharacterized protein GSPATT00022155001 [Paramecium tetraurelia]CAK88986.1 unnamed protein product [Paramecium tetraurelia]|eukprot:XP_001456383.1 hypothetical protein (macronuclear) [Paramecium tetraurelia strain d4-2]
MNSKFLNNQTSKIQDIGPLIYMFCEIYKGEQFFEVQNASGINGIKQDWLFKIPQIQRQDITELIKYLLRNPDGLNYDQAIQKFTNLNSFFSEANQSQNKSFQQIQQPPARNNLNSSITSIINVPTEQFPRRQFILTQQLGAGGEGVVYKATPINESFYNADVAVKIQNSIKNDELNFIKSLIDYQCNLEPKSLKKSNLIRLYELYKWNNNQLIVMELGGKNLFNFLTEKKYQSEMEKLQICQQITQAIAFLHEKQIFHRDIKPENFIQCGNIFKLIDFGLIKNKNQNVKLTKMVGTPLYQAPEILQGSDEYSYSVDIWSLGCLFFEIFKYEPLFNCTNIEQVKNAVVLHCNNQQTLNNQIDQLQIKQELKNLIKQMVHPLPNSRPTIQNVLTQLQPSIPQAQSIIPIAQSAFAFKPSLSLVQQFQPQKIKGQEDVKLQSAINDYLMSQISKSNYSIQILQPKDLEQIFKNISDKCITFLNEEIKNQFPTQQQLSWLGKQADNFCNKPTTKVNMLSPKNYQKNIVDEIDPNFDSEIHINEVKSQRYSQHNNKQNQINYNGFGQSVINPQTKHGSITNN